MGLIQFYPLDISIRLISQHPAIILYGRTKAGDRISVVDSNYLPYFYVVPRSNDTEKLEHDLSRLRTKVKDEVYSVVKVEKKTAKLLEKETLVLKIYINNPFASSYLHEEIIKHPEVKGVYEHDIPFFNSYMIDNKIIPGALTDIEGEVTNPHSRVPVVKADSIMQSEDEVIKPRMLAFDIEAYAPKGKSASPERDPILMISFYSDDPILGEVQNGPSSDNPRLGFKKTITWKKTDNAEHVENEFEMLNKFKRTIEEYQPDFLIGYASDIYAFPYIKRRADKFGIKLDLGADRSLALIGKDETSIRGVVHADLYKFISKVYSSKLETDTLRLEEVALELLGEGKKDIDISNLGFIWDNKPEQLGPYCEYNLNDAMLIYKLAAKLMPSIFEYAKLTNMDLFDVIRGNFTQFSDAFLVKESRFNNELIPNRPSKEQYDSREGYSYQGFSLEPDPGIYNSIAVYDFKSLYPSIIATHNISIGALRCRCCDEIVPNEEMHFCKKVSGFIPRVIGNLIDRRQRILKILNEKSEILTARQESLKSLTSSLCFAFSFPSSRWYNIECAKAINAYGKFYTTLAIDKAKEEGLEVVYADDESIFLRLGHHKLESVKKTFEELNTSLPEKMNLEYEGFYPRGIFIASKTGKTMKKRYALLSEHGFLKIKGLEATRRNFSTIAKETQEAVLNLILKERKLRKALHHVQNVISDVQDGTVPLRKLMIYTQLTKDISRYETIAPHVAVAKRMQEQGFNVTPGSIIRYIIGKKEGSIAEKAQLPNEVAEYDSDYYINHQIIPAVEKIFEAAGVDFAKALEEKEQSSLSEFI